MGIFYQGYRGTNSARWTPDGNMSEQCMTRHTYIVSLRATRIIDVSSWFYIGLGANTYYAFADRRITYSLDNTYFDIYNHKKIFDISFHLVPVGINLFLTENLSLNTYLMIIYSPNFFRILNRIEADIEGISPIANFLGIKYIMVRSY